MNTKNETKDENNEPALQNAIDQLKHSLENMPIPKVLLNEVPQYLFKEFEKQHKPKSQAKKWLTIFMQNKWQSLSGVTFSVAMLFSIFLLQQRNWVSTDQKMQMVKNQNLEKASFIILDEASFLEQKDNLKIISSAVPNRILAASGISINPQNLAGQSNAELLVGEENELLAVRFVSE